MESGLFWGYVGMVEGLVRRMNDEIGGSYELFHGVGVATTPRVAIKAADIPLAQAYDEMGSGYQVFHGNKSPRQVTTASRNSTSSTTN